MGIYNVVLTMEFNTPANSNTESSDLGTPCIKDYVIKEILTKQLLVLVNKRYVFINFHPGFFML